MCWEIVWIKCVESAGECAGITDEMLITTKKYAESVWMKYIELVHECTTTTEFMYENVWFEDKWGSLSKIRNKVCKWIQLFMNGSIYICMVKSERNCVILWTWVQPFIS